MYFISSVADRPIFGSLGIIDCVMSIFEINGIKPIQYGCIGILKNLTADNNGIARWFCRKYFMNDLDANVYRLLTGLKPPHDMVNLSAMPAENPNVSPLNRLVSFIWKATDDNDTGIRNEGGRVIVNIVKTCHRSQGMHNLQKEILLYLAFQFIPIF